jgi:hypothetical protein
MSDLRLTDLTQATGITINDLLHIVITGDTSQDPAGSSYKASVGQLYDGLSGYCVPDLYVSNLHSCSPLNINPLDEGGVYFGSTSGITLDVTNKRIGINTSTPQYALDIKGSQSNLYYDPTSVGGNFVISGSTGIPRMGMTIPAYLTKPTAGFNLGMRAWDDVTFTGYGKVGDAFFYAGNQTNGFNILNPVGTGTEDYIRFYAGQTANGTTPDMHIQGSGTTRGFVGIGTELPTEKLHISGGDMLVENTNGKYYTDIQNATGPLTILSGDSSGVSRIGVIVPTYDSITLGIRGASAVFPGYGKQGDAFIYSSNANNGFNLISSPGTGTDDYIRFYAGQTANGTTSDIHIQGSGSTRGYVGIGTEYPTEKLHVSGNTIISSGLTATTLNISSTPTTDTGTTTNVLVRDVSTGVIKQRDITSTLNKNYASFYDTGDQTGLANTVLTMSANTSDSWNTGITLSANTRFVIQNPGVYNLAFSAQMVKTGGNSSTHAHIWLYQNGLDVLYSASQIGFPSNTVYVVPAWNFFFSTTTPNEYVELKWEINSNVDNQLLIKHQPAAGSVPAIPSVIVTINQVN